MTKISAEKPRLGSYLSEVWDKRYLIWVIAKRDINVSYVQTKLSFVWFVFQPLIWLGVFSIFFGKILPINTGNIPYPIFAFTGIIVWFYFTNIINLSANALEENAILIKQVYFPKLIIYLSKLISSVVVSVINLSLLIVLMLFFGIEFQFKLLLLPFIILFVAFIGFTVSIWMAALSYRLRDLKYAIPILMNFAIWLTPVFYPNSLVPEPYGKIVQMLNPIGALIELSRWVCFDSPFPEFHALFPLIGMIVLLYLGLLYFIRKESYFAEKV